MRERKHFSMITKWASDHNLVVLLKTPLGWVLDRHPKWDSYNEYFICQWEYHKEILAGLNGEPIQIKSDCDWADFKVVAGNWAHVNTCIKLSSSFRVKPKKLRKVKRYLLVTKDGWCSKHHSSKEELIKEWGGEDSVRANGFKVISFKMEE